MRYLGRTTHRLADRIKQHIPTSIRKKSSTARKQPLCMCKGNKSKANCESAIGQHLINNPECTKTYTDDNFRINGQARSSFHLSVKESVYITTQSQVLCRQKSSFSHWDSSSKQWLIGPNWALLGLIRRILSHISASDYLFS